MSTSPSSSRPKSNSASSRTSFPDSTYGAEKEEIRGQCVAASYMKQINVYSLYIKTKIRFCLVISDLAQVQYVVEKPEESCRALPDLSDSCILLI